MAEDHWYSWVRNKRGGLNNNVGWKFIGYLISGGVLRINEYKQAKIKYKL